MLSNDQAQRETLEQRIKQYHGVTLAEVLEPITYLRDPGDSVIAGGSLALGLGNHLSDLDVVIAGRESMDSTRVPLEHFVKSLRVDVWKLSGEVIDGVFQRAEMALQNEAPLQGSFGDVDREDDLKLLHRVAFGVLLDGTAVEPRCVRDYREIARDLVVREYLERMRESALMAELALTFGRSITAVVNSRVAVEEALHLLIAARGLPFTGYKWLEERLMSDAPDLAPTYFRFAVLPDDPAATSEFVRQAVTCCESLTGVDLSLAELISCVAWQCDGLQLIAVGQRQVLASVRHGVLCELEGAEIGTWKRLAGGAGAPVRADARWPCAGQSPEEQLLCFRLHESGFMQLRWSRGLPPSEFPAIGRHRQ